MRFRRVAVGLTVIALIRAVHGQSGKAVPDMSAASLIEAARTALGGEAKLAAVNSIILKGERRYLNQYFGVLPEAKEQYRVMPIEYRALFPECYLAITTDAHGSQRRLGFRGPDLIDEIISATANPEVYNPPDIINDYRASFARLMLLLLLRTDTAVPLTLRDGIGSGATLEFSGIGDFPVYLDLDMKSHLPLRLRFQVRMRTGMTGSPTGETNNVIMAVDDWKDVTGYKLPHHLVQTSRERITSDIKFQSIQINPLLSADDFKKK